MVTKMNPELEMQDIINFIGLEIYKQYSVINVINSGDDKELVSYFANRINFNASITITVASAVTAYGRIHMSNLKLSLINAGYT